MTLTFKVVTQILRVTRRLNMVITSVKYFRNPTSNNEVMGQTQWDVRTDGLTDRLTDGQSGDYMLTRIFSGSIKKHFDTVKNVG